MGVSGRTFRNCDWWPDSHEKWKRVLLQLDAKLQRRYCSAGKDAGQGAGIVREGKVSIRYRAILEYRGFACLRIAGGKQRPFIDTGSILQTSLSPDVLQQEVLKSCALVLQIHHWERHRTEHITLAAVRKPSLFWGHHPWTNCYGADESWELK